MSLEDEYKRLRGYLNPTIRGKNTTAILEALAPASLHLVNNIIYSKQYLILLSYQLYGFLSCGLSR